MKRILTLALALLLALSVCSAALAVNEDVEGELVIYTSMYPFVIDMMDEAIKEEFPNLTPGVDGSFFFYAGTSKLITKIYGEMGDNRDQPLDCDMFMVAEPAFSLELKDYGYLHPFEIEDADSLLRFPYDEEGYWYPVRVCNMVLAYNPEMEDEWAAKGVTIPKTFKDFAEDPALKGYISMGNPMTSGTAYAAVCSLLDKYGEEYFDKLNANKVMRESGSTAIAKLQSGECAAIMILEESILKYIDDEAKNGQHRHQPEGHLSRGRRDPDPLHRDDRGGGVFQEREHRGGGSRGPVAADRGSPAADHAGIHALGASPA